MDSAEFHAAVRIFVATTRHDPTEIPQVYEAVRSVPNAHVSTYGSSALELGF